MIKWLITAALFIGVIITVDIFDTLLDKVDEDGEEDE